MSIIFLCLFKVSASRMILVIWNNGLLLHVITRLLGHLLFCNNHEINGKGSYRVKILSLVFTISWFRQEGM